jgi:hypothetical protein
VGRVTIGQSKTSDLKSDVKLMNKPQIVLVKKTASQPEKQVQTASQERTKKAKSHAKQIKTGSPATLQFQSLAVICGHLSADSGVLTFRCSDGVVLPITGIDSRLALWLLGHPVEAFSTEICSWIVYPKRDPKTEALTINLKNRLKPGATPMMEPDTSVVKGKLIASDGDKLTVLIRRNLSPNAYRELQHRQMLGEFASFTVDVWQASEPKPEVGQIVELNCKRVGERLLVDTLK